MTTTRTLTVPQSPEVNALVLPLTSIWRQPPCCPRSDSDGVEGAGLIFFDYTSVTTSCGPPEFSSVWWNKGFYSPAICPSGYTIGCSVTGSVTSGGAPDYALRPGESAYKCVPRNWTCLDWASSLAEATLTRGARVPAIEIRFQSSDLSLFETPPFQGWSGTPVPPDPSPSTSQCPSTKPSLATPTPTPTGTVIPVPTRNTGLSAGARAGIAVGAALGGLLLLAALLAFIRHRRKHATKRPLGLSDVTHPDYKAGSELNAKNAARAATELPYVSETHEADAQSRVPLVAQPYLAETYPSELPSNIRRGELP